MSIRKRMGVAALALILGIGTLELRSRLAVPGVAGYVTRGDAVVGRRRRR